MQKEKILITTNFFIPGYKAGGPIRSLTNIIDWLGNDFDFYVFTSDRDLNDKKSYSNIKKDRWNKFSSCQIFYTRTGFKSLFKYIKLIRSLSPDVIYINSFFSVYFSILPLILRKLGYFSKTPIIISPRGEFSKGALGLKTFKKKVFIQFSKILRIHENLLWQVSSKIEKNDLIGCLGERKIFIAPNLPQKSDNYKKKIKLKNKGFLKVIFLSRISEMKNLLFALDVISQCSGKIEFNIYGPIEDTKYWLKCYQKINNMPLNISVRYNGEINHDKVNSVLIENDIFLLPTKGENYGHVIIEALTAGCPILISDCTQWRNLEEKGIGWDIPLKNRNKFIDIINECVEMSNEVYSFWSINSILYSKIITNDNERVILNKSLFREASRMKSGSSYVR